MRNLFAPPAARRALVLWLGLVSGGAAAASAQAPPPPPPHQIQWYEPVIAAAGVSVFFLVDNPVRNYMLDNQTETKENLASSLQFMGEPAVWAGVPAVMIGSGLVFRKPGLARSGLRAVTSAAMAGGVTYVLKWVFGRERPNEPGSEPLDFEPFAGAFTTSDASFPSGHTSSAFGFAASLAGDVRPLWAKIGLYTLATGTAWSRVYDNKHWTSDVVAGAIVGITSARLVSGKWQVWGIRPPAVFTDGHQVTVSWHGEF
ncbi:MAG TPA: phosphatase PAP2 family protein [Gemmatimonadales bacterium]|nr:phosphatase PAP2 family protein [Gemmatimonadales bacterium]